jgi:hypothetical protein
MSSLNTNIEDYSVDELLQVLNLDDNPSSAQINSAADMAIKKVKSSYNYDQDLVALLEGARDSLINEFYPDYFDEKQNSSEEPNKWFENQYFQPRDPNQELKLTNRQNQVDIFNDNSHFPMKQNFLGVNQSVQLPVTQDSLNPTLRNINTRIITIDSQFRPNILPFNPVDPNSPTSSTNYNFELSQTLTNVLSILLYSVQIPNTWYRFSLDQGNTCFKYEQGGLPYYFNLPSGNYDSSTMKTQLNTSSNWVGSVIPSGLSWDYNQNTSKFSVTLASSGKFTFYDISGSIDCSGSSCFTSSMINQNLGWSLGFRPDSSGLSGSTKIYTSFIRSFTSGTYELDAVADLYGPKYFSIILDDFNQNRQNKGLVGIGVPEDSRLSLPSYYSSDLQFDCNGGLAQAVRTIGKKITQAQIYSINQILQNRNTTNQRQFGSNSSDVLAVLPIDMNSNIRQQPYTSFGANLILNERRYYGPVDISKMKVRLVDDKGNTINLNGADWCMSLIVNELYQY